jgi:hypothetical protein
LVKWYQLIRHSGRLVRVTSTGRKTAACFLDPSGGVAGGPLAITGHCRHARPTLDGTLGRDRLVVSGLDRSRRTS